MKRLSLTLFAIAGTAAVASAASLNLSYSKTLVGSLYQYDLTLSIDTSTAFTPGMGWGWVVFGDVGTGTSLINDFTLTSSFTGTGPWTSIGGTSGGHNGPDLQPVANGAGLVYWTPGSASETVHWVGTSAFNAPDNTLQFSNLITTGGATAATFKTMTVQAVPEPCTLLALGGLAAGVVSKRRRR